jgi:hypothetical protein
MVLPGYSYSGFAVNSQPPWENKAGEKTGVEAVNPYAHGGTTGSRISAASVFRQLDAAGAGF